VAGGPWLCHHGLADPLPGASELSHVVGVQPCELGTDEVGQSGIADESAVGVGGGMVPRSATDCRYTWTST
jgi:hypothetical protein